LDFEKSSEREREREREKRESGGKGLKREGAEIS
jgi:hypothetical protein